MDVKLYKSISELDEEKWNSIVGRNRIICTYRYLKAVEGSGINDCRYYYPVVYDGERIVAHACVYSISTELDLFAQGAPKRLIDLIRKRWKRFFVLRSLECGTPVELGTTMSFAEGIDEKKALGLIIQEVERLAKELKINTLLFRDFYDDQTPFFDHLEEAGYLKIHNLQNTKLRIDWDTYEEYLGAMRSQYRCKIAKRMEKFKRGNISVRVMKDFAEHAEDLKALWTKVHENAKEYTREVLDISFFENIDKYLGDKSGIILMEKGDIPVGCAILLFDEETLVSMYYGLDYKYNEEYCVYFNLLYKTVEVAIEEGMKEVDFGITTLVPKKDIGAEVVPLSMYMKHTNPLLDKIIPPLFDMMTPQDKELSRYVYKKTGKKKPVEDVVLEI
ncbi:MAG: GNAT family N-acetyltransferase [Candidatus Omnitrophota bacterium]|jgi:predicted N-acyltransferase